MIFSRRSYIVLRGPAKIQTVTSLGCCSRRNWWRVQMSREAAKFNLKRTRSKRAPLPDPVTYQRCKRIHIERFYKTRNAAAMLVFATSPVGVNLFLM